jgi:hypothetical protein
MSEVTMLNTNTYAEYFGFRGGKIDVTSKYIISAPRVDRRTYGDISGEPGIDTPLEFALLSYYSPITIEDATVRTNANAILPANDPRTAGLKLGAAVYKELVELKFLADASRTSASATAAIGGMRVC